MTVSQARALEQEHSYHLFFEANPLPMWVYDNQTLAFVAVNTAAVMHYGYSKNEFLRMTLREIRSAAEGARMLASRTFDLEDQLIQKGIWTHRTKAGREILVDVTTCRIKFQGRECKLALAHDVTQSERTRAELVEWMNRYEAAIKASGQTLYDWDLGTGTISYHGPLADKLGYSHSDLQFGLAAFVHLEDQQEFRTRLQQAVADKSRFSFEYRVRKQDGSYLWIEDIGHWVKNKSGQVVRLIGFINDVSERRSLEAQLRQSQKMDALGRLAGGIAHDFNNLLGVILGYSQLLIEESLPDPLANRARGVLQAAERAAGLTRQLLVFSRQEVVCPKILDLNTIIANMETMLARMIGEDVRLVIDSKANWTVKADPGQMEQVLMNLVINARDAMPNGGTIAVQTSDINLDSKYAELHPAVSSGPYVQISVADTGVGMTSDIRSRIFEPFFTTKARGTGLGLATVYGIVKQCGGAVSVYSEPDHGSVFKVYLPACTESVRLETIAPMSESRGGNETVLLAEDESSYRNLIHEVLTNKGYKVLVAKDGKEATNILSGASNVDLLLTDSVMPSAAGAILVKEAKKQFPDIKIIMMSGYTDRTLEIETVAADLFLQKPFTPSELLAQVRQILDGQP